MDFQTLQSRLASAIRLRIRTGELTERGLARLTGVSQPPIQHSLKGARTLSPEIGDLILRELKLSLLDLIQGEELAARMRLEPVLKRYREVPVADGRIGPGHVYPDRLDPVECFPFPLAMLAALVKPVAARLAADPRMSSAVAEGDLALLDQCEGRRREPDSGSLYVVSHRGEALVRWVRQGARCIYLVSQDSLEQPRQWVPVSVTAWDVLEVVKARIVWMGRRMDADTYPAPWIQRPATSR